jgi:hypothetical protein
MRVMPYWMPWSSWTLMYGAVRGIGIAGCDVPNARNVTVGWIGAGLLVMPRSAPQMLYPV